ncbi:MAG TPA: hypothetical protein VLD67_05480 [Vicinamibacterales bacterium]|nr:hypothetical protein [Vicinamibacterales bacterium]
MSEDQLPDAIESVRTRLQAELDAQFAALATREEEVLAGVRRDVEAEAEQRSTAKVESARAEWASRLESELAAARAEAEQRWTAKLESVRAEWASRLESELAAAEALAARRTITETTRVRVEAEQAAAESLAAFQKESAESLAKVRDEMEQQLAAERSAREETRAALEHALGQLEAAGQAERDGQEQAGEQMRAIEAERQRLTSELDVERRQRETLNNALEQAHATLAHEREAGRQSALAETKAQAAAAANEVRESERQSRLAVIERLLGALRTIERAGSLTEALAALFDAASAEAPRAALFVVNGAQLQCWKANGFSGPLPARLPSEGAEAGALGAALASREPVSTSTSAAPAFAALAASKAGLAIPMVVGGHAVAVLYADDGTEAETGVPPSWPETVQVLVRHGSAWIAYLTAIRTAQVVRAGPRQAASTGRAASPVSEDDNAARRYAKLLVSEIKLYNEAAVRVGREKGDLLDRLRPEIDRARRLYEERVSPAVGARAVYFQQELVQTLADGDAARLGRPGAGV